MSDIFAILNMRCRKVTRNRIDGSLLLPFYWLKEIIKSVEVILPNWLLLSNVVFEGCFEPDMYLEEMICKNESSPATAPTNSELKEQISSLESFLDLEPEETDHPSQLSNGIIEPHSNNLWMLEDLVTHQYNTQLFY